MGNVAVQQSTRTQSKAANPSSPCPAAGTLCTNNGEYCVVCMNPKQQQSCPSDAGVGLVTQCIGDSLGGKWVNQDPECHTECKPAPPAATQNECESTGGTCHTSNYSCTQNGQMNSISKCLDLNDVCCKQTTTAPAFDAESQCKAAGGAGCQKMSDCKANFIEGPNCGAGNVCCGQSSSSSSSKCKPYLDAKECADIEKCNQCEACKYSSGGKDYPGFQCTTSTTPNKQLGKDKYVVCSETKSESGGVCESGKEGQRQFCYNECRPDRPGYSQPVSCSGEKGYEVGDIQKDPACGEATGPVPSPGASCGAYKHGERIESCVEAACDGLNWVQINKVCMDGQIVNYPGEVLRAGDCSGDKPPPCAGGKIAPTQPLVNPTKSPKQGGFHIGAEITTSNEKDGVKFGFRIIFYFDGCDGDIVLLKDGAQVASNWWRGSKPGDDTDFSAEQTASPVLGNGQVESITYTGRFTNYHCLGGKDPVNKSDSITCRLAVDDLGNPRVSGTGCTWKNQGSLTPVKRPTITPKPKESTTKTATSTTIEGSAQKSSDNNCEINYPQTAEKSKTFKVIVNSKNEKICRAANIRLTFEKSGSPTKELGGAKPEPVCSSNTTWTFPEAKIDEIGTYKINAKFDPVGGISQCGGNGTIEIKETGTSAAVSTVLPTDCTKINDNAIQPSCANCIDTSVSNRLRINKPSEQVTGSCNPAQKVLSWCAKNPGECVPSRDTCVNGGACIPKKTDGSDGPDKSVLSIQSYSNDGFTAFINGIKKEYYTAIDTSLYVLNATRVPGLQRLFCDPFKGQCDFYYQNPQVGT